HFIGDPSLKEEVLALQNGNRGFGKDAAYIAVVTANIRHFSGAGERNQAYVDGGLMAMSLCYSFHSLCIGTCFLNWSVKTSVDKKLHKLLGLDDAEVVVTLMAIGRFPDEMR